MIATEPSFHAHTQPSASPTHSLTPNPFISNNDFSPSSHLILNIQSHRTSPIETYFKSYSITRSQRSPDLLPRVPCMSEYVQLHTQNIE